MRPADGLWALCAFVALAAILGGLLHAPTALAHATPGGLLALYGATVAAEGGAVAWVLRRRRRLAVFLATRYRWRGRTVAAGAAAGLALSGLAALLARAEHPWLPVVSNNPLVANPAATQMPLALLLPLVLLIVGGAPLAEEALYRGLLFGGWQRVVGVGPAALGSAILFGLAHVQPALWLPMAALGAGLAGLTARTGSLWPATAAHATFNLTAIVLALRVH